MFRKILLVTILFISLVSSVLPNSQTSALAQSSVVISNLPNTPDACNYVIQRADGWIPYAVVDVPAGTDYVLNSFTAQLARSESGTISILLRVYEDTGPGAVHPILDGSYATISSTPFPGTLINFSFPPESPVVLEQGKRYEFTIEIVNLSGEAQWCHKTSATPTGTFTHVAMKSKHPLWGIVTNDPDMYLYEMQATPIASLNASAVCVGDNLEVHIDAGDGPFDITTSNNTATATGVNMGITTFTGPQYFEDITVTETAGNFESANIGTVYCGTMPDITVSDVTVTEGNISTFTITINPPSPLNIHVFFYPSDGTTTWSQDYIMNTSSPIAIGAGQTSKDISFIAYSDGLFEGSEYFDLTIVPSEPFVTQSDPIGRATILDGTPTPDVTISDMALTEGTNGLFTINMSGASSKDTIIEFTSSNVTATSGTDYVVSTTSPVIIPANSTSTTIDFVTIEDGLYEGNETFEVEITNVSNAVGTLNIIDSTGQGTINDNEATPDIIISEASTTEGTPGNFIVSISPPIAADTSIEFTATDGTATQTTDYSTATSPIIIPAGANNTTLNFTTVDDSVYEGAETFTINIGQISNPIVTPTSSFSQATGTINDNEATPDVTISDIAVTEGAPGSFSVNINPQVATNTDISFSVTNVTTDGNDYSVTSSNPVTINAETSGTTINFNTTDDGIFEGTETFQIDITGITNTLITPTNTDSQGIGTINDNEGTPTITIDDPTVTEGNAGSFTVSINPPINASTDVNFTVTDGSATGSGTDYTVTSTTPVPIPAGASSVSIDFTTNDDTIFEGSEDFVVDITSATNTLTTPSIGDGQGTATINDNDAQPVVSISPANVTHAEGNSGTTAFAFTVTLSDASAQTITVDYTTNDGTATLSDNDYIDNDNTLTFNSGGALTQTITVLVNGNIFMEPDETFTVSLNSATNATISGTASTSTGTITNDDFAPNNDLFTNATTLGTLPSTLNQSVLNATVSGTDPTLWCIADYTDSVWFSFTATADQLFIVDTVGSQYDTVVGIFTGTEGNLNVLACDDNSGGGSASRAQTTVIPGKTYTVMVSQVGTVPVTSGSDNLTLNISGASHNDSIVLFNPATAQLSIHDSMLNNPGVITFTHTTPTNINPSWVMGDWNGDGVQTPGIFDNGAFYYTDNIGPTAIWSSGFWLGNAPSRRAVVAGRFATGFSNDVGNDCIGWVDGNISPVTGDLRFSLKYWCDMTTPPQSIGAGLSAQFLGSPLPDSEGFAGTHQWVYADWDNDDLDEPGVRRGGRMTRSVIAPGEGAALYGAGMGQRWDTADGDGPGSHGLDEGVFVGGDWNGDGIATFGVVYDDNTFYYRDVFGFNPGPFEFSSQTFTSAIATPRQADSHPNASGGTTAPAPASPTVLRDLATTNVNTDTSRNVEADLSVSKVGNYQIGEVGLVGDAIVWTITVSNTGSAPANGVRITDNVPTELRVDDALSENGTIAVRGQSVIFTAESIGVGETVQFQVVTTILSQPTSGTFANSVNVVIPDGNGSGTDANLVASGTVNSVDGLPATGYPPKFRW